jgi:OFA family oxalate/formate antiporter-like MFS transporter
VARDELTQDAPSANRSPRTLFRGWYVAIGGALGNFLTFGVVGVGFGIFVKPMREELHWSVAAISIGVSLRSFEQGLLAPVTGVLIDRLGPRRMSLTGLVTLVIGLLLFSQARSLPMFYASSVVIAVGQSIGLGTPFSLVVMSWFRRMRGRAVGILNTGNGAGYLVAPILALGIGLVGWRSTLVIAALVILVVGLLLNLLLDFPEDHGLLPDGDQPLAATSTRGGGLTGMSVADVLRTPAFYLLVAATASNGTINAWIVHQVPHMENVGFSRERAALLSGLYGVISISLRFAIGWLGDTVGRKRLYTCSFVLMGVGFMLFANLTASRLWLLPLYYVSFASGHSIWVVFQQTMIADYFGVRRFATIRGLASTLQLPVGVLAPFIAGWVFDHHGSYTPAFMAYGVISISGAIWVLLIRRPMWVDLESGAIDALAIDAGVAAAPNERDEPVAPASR